MKNPADPPKLLLADDDVYFCQTLSRALTARGYTVDIAHEASSAMKLAETSLPELALIDLRLPDQSGLKLVRNVKSACPNISVVVLTGFGSIATAIEAIKLGATYYLTKPTNVDRILESFGKTVDTEIVEPEIPLSVDRLEWEHIQSVLARCSGNISAAARALSMHRRTLQRKLGKHPPRH